MQSWDNLWIAKRANEILNKPQSGWERQFWQLLSPATTELLKAELAKTSERNPDRV